MALSTLFTIEQEKGKTMSDRALQILAALFAIFVVATLWALPVRAHDVYMGIQRPDGSGISCCGNQKTGGDCRPGKVENRGGQTFIDGVPWDGRKVVPSPDHQYHVCEKAGVTYCILVPTGV